MFGKKKKTIDEIIQPVEDVIEQLAEVASDCIAQRDDLNEQVDLIEKRKAQLDAEFDRASRLGQKYRDLIS